MTVIMGLIAALAWGIHDVLVRQVSQKTSIYSALLVVLISGLFFQVLFYFTQSETEILLWRDAKFAIISGITYLLASISLYKAFEIGPVRLVSPIIATFAIFVILWGVLNGQEITPLQWAAIFAVLIGVSVVAILSDHTSEPQSKDAKTAAIGWSLSASLFFAITLELGQVTVGSAPDTLVILVTRVTAVLSLIFIIMALRAPLFPTKEQFPVLIGMGFLDAIALASVLLAGNLPNANYATVGASAFGMVTVILARFIFKESMSLQQWVAVLIAFIGIGFLGL